MDGSDDVSRWSLHLYVERAALGVRAPAAAGAALERADHAHDSLCDVIKARV